MLPKEKWEVHVQVRVKIKEYFVTEQKILQELIPEAAILTIFSLNMRMFEICILSGSCAA
jgi:hypothetical protein